MKWFGKNWRKSVRRSQASKRRFSFEHMEPRQMMTVLPITDIITKLDPQKFIPVDPVFAEGTVNFNSSTGVLDIDGSQTHDNNIQIYINHRSGGFDYVPDLLTVQLSNINSPQVWAFDPTLVTKIVVHGHNGNDFIDNRTAVPITAYGGDGNDVILGGQGADFLFGGGGDDYIDGRTNDDMIWGEGGNDVLFGDDGYDTVLGGDGNDKIFGGRGTDHLWGEGGNDLLYGEQDADVLKDTTGTNQLYTDFGSLPTRIPTVSSFSKFYVFDKNFADPTARSLVRLEYRDMNLDRNDVLNVYHVIATDGVESATPYTGSVSTSEVNDLKAMVNTNWPLKMDPVTNYFARRIALGDPANAHFQGQALGNLIGATTADHLNKLVDKWFHGADVPGLTGFTDAHYFAGNVMSGQLFVNGPSYEDVAQGKTSDCYFVAALGEVAKKCPLIIYQMITDNGDGTYTVKFYHNGSAAYVTVNRVLPTESDGTAYFSDWGGGYYNSSYNELWVALAEKAYCQLNESGWIGQDGTNSYKGIEYGWPKDAFYQITGKSANDTGVTKYLGLSDSQDDFAAAYNQGKAMVLSSKDDGTNSFIVHNHAYMVIGYDAATKRYELYNPWGYDTGSDHPATVWETWANIRHDFDTWTSVML
jgi:Ca2+-binding RTX toxin-like protein